MTTYYRKQSIISVLDVGSTKVVCLIAKKKENNSFLLLGRGHHLSQGIKGGTLTNIEAAENAILSAVASAEMMAKTNIDEVIVNISGSKVMSHKIQATCQIKGNQVKEKDIKDMIQKAVHDFHLPGQRVIHALPIEYSLDEESDITHPIGMLGKELTIHLNMITAPETIILNLENCLARCHLNVKEYVASAYASGLGCLTEYEMMQGVALIDMGGSSTSLSIFKKGSMLYTDTLAIGGVHITNDIARGLSVQTNSAERLKILYGNALSSHFDERDMIAISEKQEDIEEETHHIPRAHLLTILRPRLEEIIEILYDKLREKDMVTHIGKKIILTGGASQLPGINDFISNIFRKQVRMGIPIPLESFSEYTQNPSFTNAIGMLIYSQKYYDNNRLQTTGLPFLEYVSSGFKKIISFFKKYFE